MSTVLGGFEHQILLAVLRLTASGDDAAYTVPIVLEIEERTGRDVAPAAVYIAVRRLEKRGLLESVLETADRKRRFVRLTREGLEQLRASRRTLSSLWEGVESLLDTES